MSDCKILIQVQLIHVNSNTLTFDDDHIDQEDIKRTKIFLVPNDLDASAAAHVNVLKKVRIYFFFDLEHFFVVILIVCPREGMERLRRIGSSQLM